MPQAPVYLLWQQAGTRELRVVVGNRVSLWRVCAELSGCVWCFFFFFFFHLQDLPTYLPACGDLASWMESVRVIVGML